MTNKEKDIIITSILSKDEIDNINPDLPADEKLFDYLISNHFVLQLDWSGEDKQYQIADFLQSRLNKLSGNNSILDKEEIYKKLEKEIKKGKIERGDAPVFILKHYKKNLKKEGFNICNIDFKNDSYYLFLTSQKSVNKITKIHDDNWEILEFGKSKDNVLYVINCECKSMNVCETGKECQPITNWECDNCGRLLTNEHGDPLYEMETTYF